MCQMYLQPIFGGSEHPKGMGAMAGVGYSQVHLPAGSIPANPGCSMGQCPYREHLRSVGLQLLSPQVTTDLRHRCTDSHTGTSVSAPMVAGVIALALEAK